ncbi:MAG: YeeE/YedE family protein [Hyphomicrobiaceae bacterium]
MTEVSVLLSGGLLCGLLAGAAAQFGRLCTFSAIEDAVLAGDFRRGRAFGLALATALLLTQTLAALNLVSLTGNPYDHARIELAGLLFGAALFGLGMSLVGTCGFGLLMRAGTGDLRALVTAGILGVAAAAASGGLLSPARLWIASLLSIPTDALGWKALQSASHSVLHMPAQFPVTALVVTALLAVTFGSARFRKRPKLIVAGVLLGAAVAGGWIVTGVLADPFGNHRLESLTFVGPIARIVLLTMGETIHHATFAVGSVLGVAAGSFAVAWRRDELRWEAFDDQREMRRHILGAIFMGLGGVLAKGCTIGQGLSASSVLAATAPLAILSMIAGARLGLYYLIEGRTYFK